MALVKCRECGKQISNKATACPSCGAPLKNSSTIGGLFATIIVGTFVVTIVIGIATEPAQAPPPETPQQKAQREEHQRRTSAVSACRSFIQSNLRDPDSSDFLESLGSTPTKDEKGGTIWVQPKVRANNGFGGKTVSIFDCRVRQSQNSDWRLVSLKENN